MKLDDFEVDPSLYQPARKYVDQSIGIVLMALFVVLAFSILLTGILQFQSISSQQSLESPRSAIRHTPEIGNAVNEDPEKVDPASVR